MQYGRRATDLGLQRLTSYRPTRSPSRGRVADYERFCEAAQRADGSTRGAAGAPRLPARCSLADHRARRVHRRPTTASGTCLAVPGEPDHLRHRSGTGRIHRHVMGRSSARRSCPQRRPRIYVEIRTRRRHHRHRHGRQRPGSSPRRSGRSVRSEARGTFAAREPGAAAHRIGAAFRDSTYGHRRSSRARRPGSNPSAQRHQLPRHRRPGRRVATADRGLPAQADIGGSGR